MASVEQVLKTAAVKNRVWLSGLIDGVCARDKCTRTALADALGVARSTIWTWVEGANMPKMEAWLKLRALRDGELRVRRRKLEAVV